MTGGTSISLTGSPGNFPKADWGVQRMLFVQPVLPTLGKEPLATLVVALLLGLTGVPAASAYELEPGLNSASVIEYPTADDQYQTHVIASTIELIDIGAPVIALEDVRYGLQLGAFQAVADAFFLTEPDRKFDHGIVRAKLRLLRFEPERTSVAVGALARITDSDAGRKRIDDRHFSLMGIITTELFPFRNWGGFLVNAYLDNLVFNLGLKVQVYRFVKVVSEFDYFHAPDRDDREQGKGGIEIEGTESFYFQLFWAERFDHALVRVGVGF